MEGIHPEVDQSDKSIPTAGREYVDRVMFSSTTAHHHDSFSVFLAFVKMLNEMRFGTLTAQSIAKFESLRTPRRYDDGIEPTSL